MDTFIIVTSLDYLKEEGKEHYWRIGESPTSALLAGSLLVSRSRKTIGATSHSVKCTTSSYT